MSQEDQRGPSSATGSAALQAGWSHGHRDVSGGWLRQAVFGAVDGLVTNASLISGLGGGGVSAHTVVLTGVAALVAGAFSMGTGEYISVTNQNELIQSEVSLERRMLHRFPAAEQEELAGYFRQYGADADTADRMAAAVSSDPGTALRLHAREELGVDPDELPSPVLAGAASLLAFSVGALVPLLPYLVGAPVLGAVAGADGDRAGERRNGGGPPDRPPGAALGSAPARPGRHRRSGDLPSRVPDRQPRRLTWLAQPRTCRSLRPGQAGPARAGTPEHPGEADGGPADTEVAPPRSLCQASDRRGAPCPGTRAPNAPAAEPCCAPGPGSGEGWPACAAGCATAAAVADGEELASGSRTRGRAQRRRGHGHRRGCDGRTRHGLALPRHGSPRCRWLGITVSTTAAAAAARTRSVIAPAVTPVRKLTSSSLGVNGRADARP